MLTEKQNDRLLRLLGQFLEIKIVFPIKADGGQYVPRKNAAVMPSLAGINEKNVSLLSLNIEPKVCLPISLNLADL